MIKSTLVHSVALAMVLSCSGSAALAETIRNFHSNISLMSDSSLCIEEHLKIDFGKTRKHGLYRDLPLDYECRNGKNGMHVEVGDVSCDGKKSFFLSKVEDGRLRLTIGNPEKTVTGVHDYIIKYRACNAVGFFDGKPEVYWNVTGNDWPFPINLASARLTAPNGVKPVQYASYAGATHSKQTANHHLENNSLTSEAKGLKPGQGLTLAAQFPAGTCEPPPFWKRVSWYWQSISDSVIGLPWHLIPAGILLVVVGTFRVMFGRAIPFLGSSGGGFSGGGAGGGGGGSW